MQMTALRQQEQIDGQSDEDLVDLARQGVESAIRALIKRNNRRLFRLARAVVRNDAEAEDIVQETYVRAFTKLETFRGDARFSTWLARIALNEALGWLRQQRPSAPLEDLERAIELDPQMDKAHVSKAIILLRMGFRQEGCASLQMAHDLGDLSTEQMLLIHCDR